MKVAVEKIFNLEMTRYITKCLKFDGLTLCGDQRASVGMWKISPFVSCAHPNQPLPQDDERKLASAMLVRRRRRGFSFSGAGWPWPPFDAVEEEGRPRR